MVLKNDNDSMIPTINTDIIKGRWHELKGMVKSAWGKLTDDHILKMQGSYEELEGALMREYGYEKDRAKQEIHDFLDKKGFKDAKNNLSAAKEDLINAKDHLMNK